MISVRVKDLPWTCGNQTKQVALEFGREERGERGMLTIISALNQSSLGIFICYT